MSAGEPGELWVRGPQVMSGYWKKPDETAEVFDGDWFKTGDIVQIDEDGFVKIVDRIKEMIIVGGFKVAPSEVEDILRGYDGVADLAIVGIPDADGEEVVVAAIVPEPGASIDTDAFRAYAKEHLTPYKVPKRVVTLDDLPKSLIGKVLRKRVRDAIIAGG